MSTRWPKLVPALALLATLLFPAPGSAADAAPPRSRIPEVHTTSLTGQSVDLPAQLAAQNGAVLVLGFSKDARSEARDWGRRLAVDFATDRSVLYYEMPVLASVPRLLRPWVLRQIAAEVSDRGKPHFAPILSNESEWRALARVQNAGSAYVLLLNHNGDVVSTRSGALTESAYAELRHEIELLSHVAMGTPPPATR